MRRLMQLQCFSVLHTRSFGVDLRGLALSVSTIIDWEGGCTLLGGMR